MPLDEFVDIKTTSLLGRFLARRTRNPQVCQTTQILNHEKPIPTYQLNVLTESKGDLLEVFFLNQKIEKPKVAINIPYRRNFYAVGICLRGKAELKANLETYTIEPGCLVTKPPHSINQWTFMSDDFETLTIFFTKDFISTNNIINIDKFQFFEAVAKHVFPVSATQSESIITLLRFIKQKYDTPHAYREEVLKSLITSLLYEVASIYDLQHVAFNSMQTRSQLLAFEFKKLVNAHASTDRNLTFYAEKLFITPKHLTETIKEVTGKTAGEWLAEAVILEARVLLQNPALTVAQIADLLHFTDPSTFGRFFKKSIGLSPVAYKQSF